MLWCNDSVIVHLLRDMPVLHWSSKCQQLGMRVISSQSSSSYCMAGAMASLEFQHSWRKQMRRTVGDVS